MHSVHLDDWKIFNFQLAAAVLYVLYVWCMHTFRRTLSLSLPLYRSLSAIHSVSAISHLIYAAGCR